MSVERYHSLPKKAQPTRSHSNLSTAVHRTHNFTAIEPNVCPEISEFRQGKKNIDMPVYVHHLDIDYGHLEKPAYFYNRQVYQKIVKFNDDIDGSLVPLNEEMETKRVTGISLWNDGDEYKFNQRNTEKKDVVRNVYLNLNTVDTCQESSKKEMHQKSQGKSSGGKQSKKGRVKLQEVSAYKETSRKEQNKRKLHSRIVKMIVAGGPAKTKVICYPDNADYLKLCTQK